MATSVLKTGAWRSMKNKTNKHFPAALHLTQMLTESAETCNQLCIDLGIASRLLSYVGPPVDYNEAEGNLPAADMDILRTPRSSSTKQTISFSPTSTPTRRSGERVVRPCNKRNNRRRGDGFSMVSYDSRNRAIHHDASKSQVLWKLYPKMHIIHCLEEEPK